MRAAAAVLVTMLPVLASAHVVRTRLVPDFASECPAATTVLEALSARGVTVEWGDDWAWRIEAHPAGESWRAVVDISRPGTPPLHRVLEGARCEEVVEGA
ncbi:MAG: hypothetical protein JNG84_06195, partial [Archangium sp.]|nr:hypothetical protein [Archangium sp.]